MHFFQNPCKSPCVFFVLCYLLNSPPRGARKILPRISVPGISMSVCLCVLVVDGSLDLSAQATVLFIRLGHNWRCLKVYFEATDESGQRCVRCWLPFCAFFAAIFWCHGSRFVFSQNRTSQRIMTQNRARWRAASSEAFALYVIIAGCGRAPKAFPKRAHKRACSRLVRIM